MPEPTSLFLARAIRDLEKLRGEADAAGLSLLGYLIDLAILEARERQRD